MIYFVQDSATGCVKIGVARDPWRRFKHLQIGTPSELQMLAFIEGCRADEAALHRRFAALHVRGEWFRPEGDLAALLATLPPPVAPSRSDRPSLAQKLARITGAKRRTAGRWIEVARIPAKHWCAINASGLLSYERLSDDWCGAVA